MCVPCLLYLSCKGTELPRSVLEIAAFTRAPPSSVRAVRLSCTALWNASGEIGTNDIVKSVLVLDKSTSVCGHWFSVRRRT